MEPAYPLVLTDLGHQLIGETVEILYRVPKRTTLFWIHR
jgi:hypothetical protein